MQPGPVHVSEKLILNRIYRSDTYRLRREGLCLALRTLGTQRGSRWWSQCARRGIERPHESTSCRPPTHRSRRANTLSHGYSRRNLSSMCCTDMCSSSCRISRYDCAIRTMMHIFKVSISLFVAYEVFVAVLAVDTRHVDVYCQSEAVWHKQERRLTAGGNWAIGRDQK